LIWPNLFNSIAYQVPAQPLEARLQLAISISIAVAYLHAMSFVHKLIRSSNILITYSAPLPSGPTTASLSSSPDQSSVLQSAEGPQIGTPYLAGFSYARRGTARSTGSSRADWRNEIYRHPERQAAELGVDPEVYYKPYHDVYSLGVVLLELGLWERLDTTYEAQLKRATASQRRDRLIDLASRHLSSKVGSTFSRIVRGCLEVDADTEGGEDQMTVQKVLEGFEEIRF
jgi:serine/threonine protein kinase